MKKLTERQAWLKLAKALDEIKEDSPAKKPFSNCMGLCLALMF